MKHPLSANVPELLPRLQVALSDRYRLERELGAGGMATVYLAEDLKHHRKVAVKVLRPDLAASMGSELTPPAARGGQSTSSSAA